MNLIKMQILILWVISVCFLRSWFGDYRSLRFLCGYFGSRTFYFYRQKGLGKLENKLSAPAKAHANIVDIIILSIAVILSFVVVFMNLSTASIDDYISVENATYYLSKEELKLYVNFQNKGEKQIDNVSFMVSFYDTNGNELDKTTVDFKGNLSAGQSVSVWKNLNVDGKVYSVDAKITAVSITYSGNSTKFINCSYEFIKGEG